MQSPPERSWSWPFRKTITGRISNQKLSEVCSHARLRGKSLLTVAPASVLELETILIEIIEGWDFVFATIVPCPSFLFYIIAFCFWRRLLIIDRLTYEFCAEAINISQRLETWLAKKNIKCLSKSDWPISRRVPTKTAIQTLRDEAALPIRNRHSQVFLSSELATSSSKV